MNDDEEEKWELPEQLDRRANTTSTIYANTSISSPNVNTMIQAVSTIIHSQMIDEIGAEQVEESSELYFFSEEKYIKENPEAFDEDRIALLRKAPTADSIFDFLKALYECAQFSPECCIICLVYVNRLIAFTGLPLHPTNWRPLVLSSLLVSQKVWDDRYLSNSDFAYIYPFFTTEEINKLEQKLLELIQFSVTVKSSLYAKYYFELRALFKENAAEFPLQPLDKLKAEELEGRSSHVGKSEKSKFQRLSQTQVVTPSSTKAVIN